MQIFHDQLIVLLQLLHVELAASNLVAGPCLISRL
jgi:hypothetical protein